MTDQIVALLHKWVNGTALNEDEQQLLDKWQAASPHNALLLQELKDQEGLQADLKSMLNYNGDAIWSKIHDQVPLKKNVSRSDTRRIFRHHPFLYAAAVVLLVLLAAGAWFIFSKPSSHNTEPVVKESKPVLHDIEPATDKAILTLSDGRKIVLDNSKAGALSSDGNTNITRTSTGSIAYKAQGTSDKEPVYNTITVPRGGKIVQLELADGSVAVLNAASSITYPTFFIGKERKISITGEAYFEVAKNAAMPFIVNARGVNVEVLGTHFNVNAYDDESKLKVTLLEGKVKVSNSRLPAPDSRLLSPGEQAQVDDKKITVTKDINLDETMAWKNGSFIYEKADMQTIMRQVARWYDADVVFQDNIEGHYVVTGIPRNVTVSKLLDIFEKTGGVHFDIEGKKIIVKR